MKRVAFLSFDWDFEIVSEYYLGLRDHIKDCEGVQVVIFSAVGQYYASHKPKESTLEIFTLVDVDAFDGFLIQGNRTWPPELRQAFVDEATRRGKPVVSINYELQGATFVGTNNYQEEYDLVTRVLEDRGCQKPAFVNGLKTSVEAQARFNGYRDACASLGVRDVRFYQANWQMEAGVVVAKKMLRRRGDLPDVIFCANDDLAVGVQETLMAAGVKVPDDVMTTGFDNRAPSQQAKPRITTIDRDYRTVAVTALDAILALIDGKRLPAQVYSPARHVFGPSCGYAFESDSERLSELFEHDGVHKRFYDVLSDFQYAVLGEESRYAILENCERFGRGLDVRSVYLTLNDSYLDLGVEGDASTYGPTSHLAARCGRSIGLSCNEDHLYARFPSKQLLPSEIPFSEPIYTVLSLRHRQTSIGTIVCEGVPTIMRYGFLSFFLTALSESIESARKGKLLKELLSRS